MIADLEAAPSQTVTLRSRDNQHLEGWDLLGRSFDRVVMVAQTTTQDAGDPGVEPCLGKQWSRDCPINVPALPDANLRYQKAIDWRRWTKGGCSFRAILIELSLCNSIPISSGI